MPSATYFLSTATKSKQKMPLLKCRRAGTAQIPFLNAQSPVAYTDQADNGHCGQGNGALCLMGCLIC
jgi:hypothetical protein